MKKCKLTVLFAVVCVGLAALPALVRADTISLGSSSDTYIRDGRSNDDAGPSIFLDARVLGSGAFVPYIQFDMSGLNIDTISSATLRVWRVAGSRNDGITTGRFSTYGLNDDPNNTLQHWHESNDFDPNDATDGLDFRNVGLEWNNTPATFGVDPTRLTSLDADDLGTMVTESVNGGTGEVTLTGAGLVAFLNARADASGLVTFLLPIESAPDKGYGFASKENADTNLHPKLDLEYSVVPEPATAALLLTAALTTALMRRREV